MSRSKNDNIVVTPSSTRSLRKNFSVTPVTKRISHMTTDPAPRLKPILKPPPPIVTRDIGAWMPPRKKSDSSQLSDITLVGSNRESLDPPKKIIHSLQTIKQKFMLKEQPLPWEQYASTATVNCQQSSDYEDMIQQLNVSHALGAAFNFKTMSFVDADKLVQKSEQLKQVLESMYGRIRVYSDTTRATIMSLKLDAPQNKHLCQLNEYAVQIEQLLDEFHFTSKYANHLQTTYLQHLAGTLCHRRDDSQLSILTRLKSIFEEETSFPSPSSSTSSLCNSPDIHQQIDTIIEKLSRRFKMNTLFDVPTKILDTHDELAKQRERSASLVLELEKNRSQRRSQTQKKEIELVNLKEQLMQETLSRQLLQNRVIELELAMKTKEETMEILRNKPEIPNNSLNKKENNHATRNNVMMQHVDQVLLLEQQAELNQVKDQIAQQQTLLNQLKKEKHDWLDTKKSILNQCYTVIDSRQDDLQLVIQHLIEKVLTKPKEEKTLQYQEDIVLLENQALLETNLKNDNLLRSKQQEIIQLKDEFNQIIKLYNTRESGYILQSASTEAELERILKEYDRLTRNIIDFNNERKKFELEIRELYLEKVQLSKDLSDEKIQNIQGNDGNLRKEFRDLMAGVKKRHAQELVEALDATKKVEQDLREKMSEIEMKRWEKVDIAVQTNIQLPF